MKLHKVLLGAVAATLVFGQVTASACFVPICLPNPSNCGPKHPVSDCGYKPPVVCPPVIVIVKPPCVPIIVIIIKKIFGC